MAQSAVHLDRENFSCSICLELLNDPVTIPCGHSYCFSCIKDHWDGEDEKGIHSCPQCRKIFIPRPELLKSTMLAALVDELKKTGLQAAPADHCYAGAEDVACDVCTGRKLKALKSCLVCRASYCDTHLQPHVHSPAFVKHQLVDPSKNLQENICSRHDEVMKIFCLSDQQCICYLCCMEEHKGHDTVSAATVRREKQEKLQESRQTIQQRIRDREQDVKMLQQKVKGINNLQEKLEQEITELKSKDAELQQLSLSEDHCHFLHNYPSLSQKLQEFLRDIWTDISPTPVDVSLSEESKTRAEFLRYSCNITLDPNTAHRELLCDGDRRLTWSNGGHLSNPDHPDRFIDYCQVLSRESLTGRCYWEVEIGGFGLNVAVTYKNIRRSGQESQFGTNDESWCLDYYGHRLRFKNISISSPVSGPWSSTVGVYLDHPAGVVSFYSVSDTMTLLYRVQTSFSQPLHAGLFLFDDDGGAEFVKLK